jgi:predicted transcriptional regulator
MPELHLKLMMTNEDFETVQELFSEVDSPKFTIAKATQHTEDTKLVEMYTESYVGLWYLAKKVQLKQCNKIFDEIMENYDKLG